MASSVGSGVTKTYVIEKIARRANATCAARDIRCRLITSRFAIVNKRSHHELPREIVDNYRKKFHWTAKRPVNRKTTEVKYWEPSYRFPDKPGPSKILEGTSEARQQQLLLLRLGLLQNASQTSRRRQPYFTHQLGKPRVRT